MAQSLRQIRCVPSPIHGTLSSQRADIHTTPRSTDKPFVWSSTDAEWESEWREDAIALVAILVIIVAFYIVIAGAQ
jgi:hypothetical protein